MPVDGSAPQVVAAADPDQISQLSAGSFWVLHEAYPHDAQFGYHDRGDAQQRISIVQVPIGGGAPATLVEEPVQQAAAGGIVLQNQALQARVSPAGTARRSR